VLKPKKLKTKNQIEKIINITNDFVTVTDNPNMFNFDVISRPSFSDTLLLKPGTPVLKTDAGNDAKSQNN